jgi:hypothetical protein
MSSDTETLERLRIIFGSGSRTNDIPRRAVLCHDGRIANKIDYPDLPEVGTLSSCCEILKRGSGIATYPREPFALLRECIDFNAPGAWQALYTDIRTGDVTAGDLKVFFDGNAVDAARLIADVLAARDVPHILGILCTIAATVPELSHQTRECIANALAQHIRPTIDVFARHGRALPSKYRDSLMTALGKLITVARVPVVTVAEILVNSIQTMPAHADMLVRACLHAPMDTCRDACPDIVEALTRRAHAIPPSRRYGYIALIAKILHADPGAAQGLGRDFATLATTTLDAAIRQGSSFDARSVLAAAILAKHAFRECPDALDAVGVLTSALEMCSAAIVRTVRLPL